MGLKLWRGKNEDFKSHFHLAFLIASDEQPVLTTELESSSKNPQTHPEASSSQLLKESGEGRIELKIQFQTQTPPCAYLMHIFSNFIDRGGVWL